MIRMTSLTSLLALAITAGQALAIDPTPAQPVPPAAPKIEEMLPGTTNAAAFINVRRTFALYGDLITSTPQYQGLEQLIAAGFPDPAKDLDQVGLVSDIEHFNESNISGVITGKLNMEKLMALAQAQGLPLTPSMYQGVTLVSATQGEDSGQIGFVDENTTLFSLDQTGATGTHEATKAIVATLKGQAPSFAAAQNFALAGNYLATLAVKVPAELQAQLAEVAAQVPGIETLQFIAGTIVADEVTKDAEARLAGTFGTEAAATSVETVLKALAAQFGGSNGGAGEIVNKIKIVRTGAVVTLSLTIPRAEMEEWVSDL